MASTGPSETMLSSLSVTMVAISMITSVSGRSPVISRSIQIRLSAPMRRPFAGEWRTVYQTCTVALVQETFDALVIAAFGRHLLVRNGAGEELMARPFGRGLSVV